MPFFLLNSLTIEWSRRRLFPNCSPLVMSKITNLWWWVERQARIWRGLSGSWWWGWCCHRLMRGSGILFLWLFAMAGGGGRASTWRGGTVHRPGVSHWKTKTKKMKIDLIYRSRVMISCTYCLAGDMYVTELTGFWGSCLLWIHYKWYRGAKNSMTRASTSQTCRSGTQSSNLNLCQMIYSCLTP